MGFKYMSKKEIECMIRTEVNTLGKFLERIQDETDYDIQAFVKISLLDDREMDISTGTLHFGDQDLVRSIVLNDDWIVKGTSIEIINKLNELLDDDMEDDENEI